MSNEASSRSGRPLLVIHELLFGEPQDKHKRYRRGAKRKKGNSKRVGICGKDLTRGPAESPASQC